LYEARDVIWAWAMLAVGAALTGFGLKELLFPKPVLTVGEEGLAVRLRGPRRPLVVLAWEEVGDVGADRVDDEGDVVEVLTVEVRERSGLPNDPWGARWLDHRTLLVAGSDWESSPERVAKRITDYAVELAAGGRHAGPTGS
ncbi:MAG: hypothetical protein ACRDVM_06290, partial [Acidimicrobiia bacterium]